jgi:hypothetical protein
LQAAHDLANDQGTSHWTPSTPTTSWFS